MRRGAVLYARAADHRHRAGLRPHHLGHRRGDDRLVRHRDALLRDAEGASRPPRPRGREDRGHHLSHRGARRRSRQGPSGRAHPRRRDLARASTSAGRTSSTCRSIPTLRASSTTRPCRRTATRSRISARCAGRNSARCRSPRICGRKPRRWPAWPRSRASSSIRAGRSTSMRRSSAMRATVVGAGVVGLRPR